MQNSILVVFQHQFVSAVRVYNHPIHRKQCLRISFLFIDLFIYLLLDIDTTYNIYSYNMSSKKITIKWNCFYNKLRK